MNLLLVKKMAIKSNNKNPMVKELFTKKFKPKIVKAKKGTEMSSKVIQQIGARL